MVKVLAILPTYYPEVGGSALASHCIIDLLAKANDLNVTVLTGTQNPQKVRGVKYYYDPLIKTIDKWCLPQSSLSRRYQSILERHDVVYIAHAYPLIPVAKKFGKKTIIHLHDYRPISPCAAVLAGSGVSSNFDLLKDGFVVNLMQKKKELKL